MRRWHGGSVLAAVALTRGGNVTIPVDGGPRPALALVDGDDVCAAVRAYCDGTPFKSTGLLKDASWSATTGDGVGLPGADGCVRALAEAVQPRLERDWPATRARFAVRDDYLAGCVAADFGLDAEGPDDPLFALLAEAVAARDAASPALAEYNRRRTLLPPARRARHYRDVCLKLLPAHPGALDSLAVALRHAGRARAAELVRDGADLNRWSRAPVPDSISAQVLARGAGRGLWPSPYQRPAHHAANLTARPLWAAGALPGLERLARRTAAFGRELAVELARRADALVVRQAEGLARRLPGAPGDDWGWDEVALLKHGEVPDARVAGRAGIDGRPDRVSVTGCAPRRSRRGSRRRWPPSGRRAPSSMPSSASCTRARRSCRTAGRRTRGCGRTSRSRPRRARRCASARPTQNASSGAPRHSSSTTRSSTTSFTKAPTRGSSSSSTRGTRSCPRSGGASSSTAG